MKKKTIVKIYKIGGGVLNDFQSLEKFAACLHMMRPEVEENTLVLSIFVISAFGQLTNLIQNRVANLIQYGLGSVQEQEAYDAFNDYGKQNKLFSFISLDSSCATPFDDVKQIQMGEIVSSRKVYEVVEKFSDEPVKWIDARNVIKTSWQNPFEADVLFKETGFAISALITDQLHKMALQNNPSATIVTQGFIASSFERNLPTLLGREGSDYSAAIFAKCAKDSGLLNDVSLTFIKSTPGIVQDWHDHDEQREFETELTWRQLQIMAADGSKIFHPKVADLLKGSGIPTMVTNLDYFLVGNTDKKCTIIVD